jgi:hypothetical protein
VKRVLIITYYWPPSGGSGVQRWLKFVKYLREFGYEPVVYTPQNPELMAVDNSLCEEVPLGIEVIKRDIAEPYSLYKLLTGRRGESVKPGFISSTSTGNKKTKKKSTPVKGALKERLSLFIRSNLFIPDPKMLWIYPSYRFLKRYLRENPVDVIVSTGPPHSMHLIAKRVSKATGTPWLADFRDPWTKMYNFKYLGCTPLVLAIHKKLEKSVVSCADWVVTVTNTIAGELKELKPKRLDVITNGYDKADFPDIPITREETFTITYTGLFVPTQNPSVLWKILGERVSGDIEFSKNLKIRIIGDADRSILDDIALNGLENHLVKMEYTPHNEAVIWQRKSRILLLSGGREPESRGILTGKFFEYLAAARPILGFGPKGGDMDIALEESRAGEMFDYEDYEGVSKWLDSQYALYTAGVEPAIGGDISKYSRRELTRRVAEILDKITDRE